MKRHILVFSVCLSVIYFALTPWSVSAMEGVTQDTILIGAFGPLTGGAAWIGLGARDGMNLAVKEINEAGGIHGRKLKVVFEDDAASPSRALGAVKKLVDQDKVFMVFSGAGSNSTVGVIDFIKERQIPMFVCIASAPPVTNPFSKYLFRGGTTEVARYGEIYSSFVAEGLQAQKVAILSGRDEYPKNEAEATTKLLKAWFNIEPVARTDFNVGDKDFTPQLLEIKKANAEVIMIFGHPPEATIILRQARELGIHQPFFAGGAIVDPSVPANAQWAAEGLMGAYLLPLTLDSKDADMVKFRTAYQQEYPNQPPGRPNWCDVMAYGDMYVVIEGIKRAGKDLDREKFISAMETLRNYRVSKIASPRTFTSKHHIGNIQIQPVVVLNGHWLPLAWEPAHPSTIVREE